MGKTLFLYIFKDLLRIFMMASGAIAGILSFGGLLRPLMEQGLDASQMGQMLTYLSPAMTTYSLPIAALFATTMVYGRLSADNEIIACRASGISYWAIATPALLLGLIVSIFSLLLLCFIVPNSLLAVERIIFSNMGDLVVGQIQRNHSIEFRDEGITVFAQRAYTLEESTPTGDEQVVVLVGPTIVRYEVPNKRDPAFRVPRDFYTAQQATVVIRKKETGEFEILVTPENIAKFPREFKGAVQAGIEVTYFPPWELKSLVKFRPKFMDIFQLKNMLLNLAASDSVQEKLREFTAREQEVLYSQQIVDALNRPGRSITFNSGGTRLTLRRPANAEVQNNDRTIVIKSSSDRPDINFVAVREDGSTMFVTDATEVHLGVHVVDEPGKRVFRIVPELYRVELRRGGETVTKATHSPPPFEVEIPAELRRLEKRQPHEYMNSSLLSHGDRVQLHYRTRKLENSIKGEIHSRVSFSLSCLILVMIGCALGMMFKSGNFLSAFAVSVIPALICIALIVTGQHTAESVGWTLETDNTNLKMGLTLIWSGNAAVLLIAVLLANKLRKQ